MPRRFDLELFAELNDEYKSKPLVPRPRQFDATSRRLEAEKRCDRLDRRLDLTGKRVLEIGCGTGSVGRLIAERFGCTVVGIDINRYQAWEESSSERVTHVVGDIADPPDGLGTFDAMFSFSVWEHIIHPHTALEGCFEMLEPGGRMFIQAQLERGPKASHRYREVHFPWSHLLFTPETFEQYYESIGLQPRRPAWVNKLTFGQYSSAFDRIGYTTRSLRAAGPETFDEEFYRRFHDELSAYPRWDLGHDVITTVLERPGPQSATAGSTPGTEQPYASATQDTSDQVTPVKLVYRLWRRIPSKLRDHPLTQRIVRTVKTR